MKKIFTKSGFTLIELFIVIAIIGVLAAIGVYGYDAYRNHSQTSQNKMRTEEILQKTSVWVERNKEYPKKLGDVNDNSSLISFLSEDIRSRAIDGKAKLPSQQDPTLLSVRFCERNGYTNQSFGVTVTYWDLVERKTVTKGQGTIEGADINCVPEIIEQEVINF